MAHRQRGGQQQSQLLLFNVFLLVLAITGTYARDVDVHISVRNVGTQWAVAAIFQESDTTLGEAWTWLWTVDKNPTECFHRRIENIIAWPYNFDPDFYGKYRVSENTFRLSLDAFPKGKGSANTCQFNGASDNHPRGQYVVDLNVNDFAMDTTYNLYYEVTPEPSHILTLSGLTKVWWAVEVTITEASGGGPWIQSTSLTLSPSLALTINGRNLDPDTIEPNVIIAGLNIDCDSITSRSDTRLICAITPPESREINNVKFDVTVQTTQGSSNTRKTSWPACTHSPCSNRGKCMWILEDMEQSCICNDDLKYWGNACEHEYPSGRPTLTNVAPYGGDYNIDQVIALGGALFPGSDNIVNGQPFYNRVVCQMTWDTPGLRIDPKKGTISEDKQIIYEANLIPFNYTQHIGILPKGATVAKTAAICTIPASALSPPSPDRPRAMIRVVWYSDTTSIDSQRSFTFMLYGSFDVDHSTVSVTPYQGNNEMKVFEPQILRIYSMDGASRNRLAGGDEDLFLYSWDMGPSATYGGVQVLTDKAFSNIKCRDHPDDSLCAYYETQISFDFSGVFQLNIFVVDPVTWGLRQVNKDKLIFNVKGLGEAALPVTSRKSPIEWADQLKLSQLDLYDPALAQIVSPNTGRADRQNILGPLFQRWKGGWFTQRQTVGLAIDDGPTSLLYGTVHTVMEKGTDDPAYCDTRLDSFSGGVTPNNYVPWRRTGKIPGTFPIGLSAGGGLCIEAATLNMQLVHHDINSVTIELTRTGLSDFQADAQVITKKLTLQTATSSGAPLGGSPVSVTRNFYSTQPNGALVDLLGLPVDGDYTLVVSGPSDRGYMKDWSLSVSVVPCLQSSVVPNSICAKGNGTRYDRAHNLDDVVTLICPEGGIIDEILYARYGALQGACLTDTFTVAEDRCEADAAMVKARVETVCLGHSQCSLMAQDAAFGSAPGKDFLCPNDLPLCASDGMVGDEVGSFSSREARMVRNDNTARAIRRNSLAFPGTEDFHYLSTYERNPTFGHLGGNYLTQRNLAVACTTESVSVPRNALVVKARCKDPSDAYSVTGNWTADPPVLSASATGDFDLDLHDEEITVYGPVGGSLNIVFKSADSSAPHYHKYENIVVDGDPVILGEQLEVVTGDFDRDGFIEAVIAYLDVDGNLKAFLWDLRINQEGIWNSMSKEASSKSSCNCWDLRSQIMQTFDQSRWINFPDGFTVPSFPITSAGQRLDSAGFSFSIAAGDTGALGMEDLTIAWIADESSVAVLLFKYDTTLKPVTATPYYVRSLDKPHAVAIAMGDFEGKGYFDIALGITQTKSVSVIILSVAELDKYAISQINELLIYTPSQPLFWGSDANTVQRHNIHLVSGDLDDDGDYEVVVMFANSRMALMRRIDGPGVGNKCRKLVCLQAIGNVDTLIPLGPQGDSILTRSPELHMAIGNMDESYVNELVVAAEYTSLDGKGTTKVMLTTWVASDSKDTPFHMLGKHCYAGPYLHTGQNYQAAGLNNFALTIGNLFARGYRVGAPLKLRLEGYPELVAVINAPPSHVDYIDGDPVIVNPLTFSGSGSFSQFMRADDVNVQLIMNTETGSATTSVNSFALDARIGPLFGNFMFTSQTFGSQASMTGTASSTSLTIQREMSATGDDLVMYVSTDKDIWKYPVLDQDGNQIGTLDVEFSSSCGEQCVQKADGRELWWFTPDHEVFNLLTYSPRAPTDFNPFNRIMVGEKYLVGANALEIWVDETIGKAQAAATAVDATAGTSFGGSIGLDVKLDMTFSGAPLGVGQMLGLGALGIGIKAGYAGKREDVSQVFSHVEKHATLAKDTSIHCYFEGIDPQYSYRVQPFVYNAKVNGKEYLKLDYSAEPSFYPGMNNWWYATYNKPDPSFNLPWGWTNLPLDKTLRSKEIYAIPPYPKLGEVVEVFVTVRNKAMVDAFDVTVSLWKGDPDNCLDFACLFKSSLVGTRLVNLIPAQGQRTVDPGFRFRYDGTSNIYATIDDANTLVEFHEDNNKAYNMMFLNLRQNGYLLRNLRLDYDIKADPIKQDGKTKGYVLTAKLLSDSYTRRNVIVQFWKTMVGGSGTLLGTVYVPKVAGSSTRDLVYQVSLYMDTTDPSNYGKQDVHAVILHSGFSTDATNIISQATSTIQVDCFGDVDLCGVCGGDNSACAGCDGIPLSGKTFDVCGKCGGLGDTCCLPTADQAQRHTITLSSEGNAVPHYLRINVGEAVVWENKHPSWNIDVVGGMYDYTSAPGFQLSGMSDPSYPGKAADPPKVEALLTEAQLDALYYSYASFSKTVSEPFVGPASDMLQGKARRSATQLSDLLGGDKAKASPHMDMARALESLLSSGAFDGVTISEPSEVSLPSRRRSSSFEDHLIEEEEGDSNEDEDNEEYSHSVRACCSDGGDEKKRSARSSSSSPAMAAGSKSRTVSKKSGGHMKPRFSLRQVGMQLWHQHLHGMNMLVRNETNARERRFGSDELDRLFRSYDHHLEDRAAAAAPKGGKGGGGGAKGGGKKGGKGGDGKKKDGESCACGSGGDGEAIDAGEIGTAVTLTGVSASVTDVGGFGAGRGWVTYDYNGWLRDSSPASDTVVGPGEASVPHRFTQPGVYYWYSDYHPAVHGLIVVDYSTTRIDKCGVCGGNGTSCIDCKGIPYGDALIDPCGVCYSPSLQPTYNPLARVDCNGVCDGTAEVDDCGSCVGGSTGKKFNHAMDCAGICGGATPEVCGFCNLTEVEAELQNITDCSGECFGTRIINPCGICSGGNSGISVLEGMDCFGVCNGTAKRDCFGVCNGTAVKDCAGICGGTAVQNECKACVGGTTGLDDSQTRKCDGTCARTPAQVCNTTLPLGGRSFEEVRACTGGNQLDRNGRCCPAASIDCANLCYGSAALDSCGQCSGGSSGHDASESMDCDSVCNGTARWNPCGVCTHNNSEYYSGPGYYVDCDNVCNGGAYFDMCNYCVDGTTGFKPGYKKDCRGDCDGTWLLDKCGVCYDPNANDHIPDSGEDCNGVCGGSAIIDSCGQCAGGNTGREIDSAKDCAGQCFGQHQITDPACTCLAPNALDACFVCNGDNSSCAGCDNVPWSGKTRDRCGVCGGDGSTCCANSFPQIFVTINDLSAYATGVTLEAGETVLITNNELTVTYTIRMVRTDMDRDVARVFGVQLEFALGTVQPGHRFSFAIGIPGTYTIFAVESPSIEFKLNVVYNRKVPDSCGRCVYTSASIAAGSGGGSVAMNESTNAESPEYLAYDQCCQTMSSTEPSDWYTIFYHPNGTSSSSTRRTSEEQQQSSPSSRNRRSSSSTIVANTGFPHPPFASDETEISVLRVPRSDVVVVIEDFGLRSSNGATGDLSLYLGDSITFENRDSVTHILSFEGRQPQPAITLEPGTYRTTPRFLVPGRYLYTSNRNLVRGTVQISFVASCSMPYPQSPEDDGSDDLSDGEIAAISVGAFVALLLLLLLLAVILLIAALLVWKIKQRSRRPHRSGGNGGGVEDGGLPQGSGSSDEGSSKEDDDDEDGASPSWLNPRSLEEHEMQPLTPRTRAQRRLAK